MDKYYLVIHPNPGPASVSSASSQRSSYSMSTDIFNSLCLNHHFSFVQYNVQSITNKLDVLHAELLEFDILAFKKTWLSPNILTDDLLLQSYNTPEINDRVGTPMEASSYMLRKEFVTTAQSF